MRDRGTVVCATLQNTPGFGFLDADGNLTGFDIDLCRAVAAATLGDPAAVELRTITSAERGPIMQAGEVDMLVFVTTWTSARDAAWGDFVPTMFYDGQGFMVPGRLGVSSAYELEGASVCTVAGTTSELNMSDFFRQNRTRYSPVVFESVDVAFQAYTKGACDAFTTDRSALAALRSNLPDPGEHVILPETISEEPLTPLVPHGDNQWFDIVKTVMAILIQGEALGVDSRERRRGRGRRQREGKAPAGSRGVVGAIGPGPGSPRWPRRSYPRWATTGRYTTAIWAQGDSGCRGTGTPCGPTPPASTARGAARSTPLPSGSARRSPSHNWKRLRWPLCRPRMPLLASDAPQVHSRRKPGHVGSMPRTSACP